MAVSYTHLTLANVAETEINTYQDLQDVLTKRLQFFHHNGCRLSDHGLDQIYFEDFTENEIAQIFKKRRSGQPVSKEEALKFQSAVLIFLSLIHI